MLNLLVEYAKTHDLRPEPGFAPKNARWAIVADANGKYLNIQEVGDPNAKRNPGRRFDRAPEMSFTDLKAGGVTKCHFLIESADVVALVLKGNEAEKALVKVRAKHAYFVQLLRDASAAMPELAMFAELLGNDETLAQVTSHLAEHKAKPTDKVTLAIQDDGTHFPADSDAWSHWWRDFRATLVPPKPAKPKGAGKTTMVCLISGEEVEPVATQPKIKGLGDAMGDVYASFKQDSFCSYGLVQSANAAMSEEAAAAYRAALNRLLDKHSQRLAAAKVVHWFSRKVPDRDDPLPWLEAPAEQDELNAQDRARQLLESIKTGQRTDLADNHFYALTLSGAAGRVMVRDWMEGQFETLVANVAAWFEDLAIVRRDGDGLARPPKFLAVLGATVRDLKDVPAPFVAKMWRVAVNYEPIPQQALAQALARTKVDIIQDNTPNHARMGLIKAYFVRSLKGGKDHMSPFLNEDHPEQAYQCGRLMAVLADVQRAALGDVGAGIVQRFYAAASSTPALVLGRLTRQSQFHLNKLDPGLAYWFESRIADIWTRIKDRVPPTLTLEEQSLFALGYYQQLAANRPKKATESNTKEESNE